MASSSPRHQNLVASQGIVWGTLAVFLLALAMLGGTSRFDAVQTIALRPLAALALIPALCFASLSHLREARVPAFLLVALCVWMALQIVPLPPSVWMTLPGRDVIAELDKLAGAPDVWRPLSMVPVRGYNALASLIVPVAAMVLALVFRLSRRDLFLLIAGLGALNALLGFAQVATGENGPLYLYSSTNRGSAVGLLANENHSSVFSSIVMLVAARLALNEEWCKQLPWIRIAGVVLFIMAMIAVIINGSRAGAVTGLLAVACCIVMVYLRFAKHSGVQKARDPLSRSEKRRPSVLPGILGDPLKIVTASVLLVIGLVALFIMNGRAVGIEDALQQDAFEDLRWSLFPILRTMASTHWLVGTGFGSFEEVYHIYEPTELLLSVYINHAHNDWAQLLIEGGLPSAIILAAFLVWIAKRLVHVVSAHEQSAATVLFWGAIFAIVMAASLIDYPLRMPIFQGVMIWLVVAFASETDGASNRLKPA